MGMHFANTTNFDVRKAANPSSGRDRRADRMKSNANSESRPRAPAVSLQGDGVASINMLSIGSSSIPAAHSLDESAFGTKRTCRCSRQMSVVEGGTDLARTRSKCDKSKYRAGRAFYLCDLLDAGGEMASGSRRRKRVTPCHRHGNRAPGKLSSVEMWDRATLAPCGNPFVSGT
jgi:hypothetical protein